MKTLLTIAAILMSFCSYGQIFQKSTTNNAWNRVKADSAMYAPLDTFQVRPATQLGQPVGDSGRIAYKNQKLYFHNGGSWQPVSTGGGSLSEYLPKFVIDSIPQLYSIEGKSSNDIAFVKDTIRGGLFYYTSTTPTADSGVVIPASSGRWVRLMSNLNSVQLDWWKDSWGNSSLRKAVNYLSLRGGGTIYAGYGPYSPSYFYDGTANNILTVDNISIIGKKMPHLSSNAQTLQGGTIFIGSFAVAANNFNIENVGINSGLDVINAFYGGVPQEGFFFYQPSQVSPVPHKKNLRAVNIIGLCSSPSALTHAVLFENMDGGVFDNVTGVYGVHGIVIKGKNAKAGMLQAFANQNDGLIIKADSYASGAHVQVSQFTYDSIPHVSSPYTVAGRTGAGLFILSATSSIGDVNVTHASVQGCEDGLRIETQNGNEIGDINVMSLDVNACNDGIEYVGNNFYRVNVGDADISNCSRVVSNGIGSSAAQISIGDLVSDFRTSTSSTGVLMTGSSGMTITRANLRAINTAFDISSGSVLFITEDFIPNTATKYAGSSVNRVITKSYGTNLNNESYLPFSFKISGTERANISSTGLAVSGNISRTNGTVGTLISSDASTFGSIGTSTAHDFVFATNNVERARLTNAGMFGVGITPTSTTHVAGSFATAITTTGSNITLTVDHGTLIATSPLTITLPAASAAPGRIYYISNYASGGNLTLSIGVLKGGATVTSVPNNANWRLQSNGTSWYVTGE